MSYLLWTFPITGSDVDRDTSDSGTTEASSDVEIGASGSGTTEASSDVDSDTSDSDATDATEASSDVDSNEDDSISEGGETEPSSDSSLESNDDQKEEEATDESSLSTPVFAVILVLSVGFAATAGLLAIIAIKKLVSFLSPKTVSNKTSPASFLEPSAYNNFNEP